MGAIPGHLQAVAMTTQFRGTESSGQSSRAVEPAQSVETLGPHGHCTWPEQIPGYSKDAPPGLPGPLPLLP